MKKLASLSVMLIATTIIIGGCASLSKKQPLDETKLAEVPESRLADQPNSGVPSEVIPDTAPNHETRFPVESNYIPNQPELNHNQPPQGQIP